MAKHKVGTILQRDGFKNITILRITSKDYICAIEDGPSNYMVGITFLDNPLWEPFTPIWLNQKDK